MAYLSAATRTAHPLMYWNINAMMRTAHLLFLMHEICNAEMSTAHPYEVVVGLGHLGQVVLQAPDLGALALQHLLKPLRPCSTQVSAPAAGP